jgi:hypothetical protein
VVCWPWDKSLWLQRQEPAGASPPRPPLCLGPPPARPPSGRLAGAPRRHPRAPPPEDGHSCTMAARDGARAGRAGWGRCRPLPLLRARGLRRRGGPGLGPRAGPLSARPPRRPGHPCPERCPHEGGASPWRPAPAGLSLSGRAAGPPGPRAAPPPVEAPPGGAPGPGPAAPPPVPPAGEGDKARRHPHPCRRGHALCRARGAQAPGRRLSGAPR